jgi:tRNA(Ile)-lysidine synthase
MQKRVKKFVADNLLLTENSNVIVGLSGGADSVALLYILHSLGYRCIAAHCNFHLRGDESDRDENFARTLTAEMDIPFFHIDFETKAFAEKNKLSIEMAARQLRYEWFEQLRINHGAEAIAVAHHLDDSIETLLMNLVRGTGLKGLTGIPCRNEFVVRPLLCLSREDIMAYLMQYNLSCVEDSTNASTEYTRNKFRHEVLPLLESINPSIRKTLYQTIERFTGTEGFYMHSIRELEKKLIEKQADRVLIDKNGLLDHPHHKTILFELLQPYGFNATVVNNIVSCLTGDPGHVFTSAGYQLLIDRSKLILVPLEKKTDLLYEIPLDVRLITEPVELEISQFQIYDEFVVSKERHKVQFDASLITFPLVLRRWQSGDSFVPFGMKNKKKVSDFFIDEKLTRFEKESCWLLTSANEIMWIVGYRTDNRFRINGQTTEILEIVIK